MTQRNQAIPLEEEAAPRLAPTRSGPAERRPSGEALSGAKRLKIFAVVVAAYLGLFAGLGQLAKMWLQS